MSLVASAQVESGSPFDRLHPARLCVNDRLPEGLPGLPEALRVPSSLPDRAALFGDSLAAGMLAARPPKPPHSARLEPDEPPSERRPPRG